MNHSVRSRNIDLFDCRIIDFHFTCRNKNRDIAGSGRRQKRHSLSLKYWYSSVRKQQRKRWSPPDSDWTRKLRRLYFSHKIMLAIWWSIRFEMPSYIFGTANTSHNFLRPSAWEWVASTTDARTSLLPSDWLMLNEPRNLANVSAASRFFQHDIISS